jgi:hypothetical protein
VVQCAVGKCEENVKIQERSVSIVWLETKYSAGIYTKCVISFAHSCPQRIYKYSDQPHPVKMILVVVAFTRMLNVGRGRFGLPKCMASLLLSPLSPFSPAIQGSARQS